MNGLLPVYSVFIERIQFLRQTRGTQLGKMSFEKLVFGQNPRMRSQCTLSQWVSPCAHDTTAASAIETDLFCPFGVDSVMLSENDRRRSSLNPKRIPTDDAGQWWAWRNTKLNLSFCEILAPMTIFSVVLFYSVDKREKKALKFTVKTARRRAKPKIMHNSNISLIQMFENRKKNTKSKCEHSQIFTFRLSHTNSFDSSFGDATVPSSCPRMRREIQKKKLFSNGSDKMKELFLLRTAWNKYLWRMKIVSLRKMAASIVTRGIKIFGIRSHLQRCAQCFVIFSRISQTLLFDQWLIYSTTICARNQMAICEVDRMLDQK